MALTTTTLAGPLGVNALSFNATSVAGASVNGMARVDGEWMRISAIDGLKVSVFNRGDHGSSVVAHDVLAPVTFGLTADMAQLGTAEGVPVPADKENIVSIGQNGNIAAPLRDTIYLITKGSALGTSTLAPPTAAQDGLQITIVNTTDFAHVVTVAGVAAGTTGAKTTLTSAAFKGSTLTLLALGGAWYVRANNLWVIT